MNSRGQMNGLLTVVLGAILLLTTPGSGLAQLTSQDDFLVPTFDLGAVIIPSEIFPLNDLYIVDGTFQTGEELDQHYSAEDDKREALEVSGFLGGYVTNYRVEAPNGMGDETGAMVKVRVSVDEFEDAEGAEDWYDYNIDPTLGIDGVDERTFPASGDQSILLESAPDTTPNSSWFFMMQQDSVTVRMLISFFWGFSDEIDYLSTSDFEPADFEPAVESLMDRLESAHDRERGVFFQTPRYRGTDTMLTAFLDEKYVTLDSEEIPVPDTRLSQGEAPNAIEHYRRSASFYNGGSSDRTWAEVAAIKFKDAESAEAFVLEPKTITNEHEESGFIEYEEVTDKDALPKAEGAVAVYHIVVDATSDSTIQGLRYFVQVGDTVLLLDVMDAGGINPEVGRVLMEASLECLEVDTFCAPISIPDDLAA